MLTDITPMLERIYASPAPEIEGLERLDFLGKLMLMSLGAATFLSIRKVEGAGVHLMPSGAELWIGLREFAYFVPFGIAASFATGFLRWSPRPIDGWTYPFEVAGSILGIYLTVALAEEMFFRGIIQNLLGKSWGAALPAQAVAAVLFGLVHLPRGFPNWRYALVAAIAGWFYGRAYAERSSIVPAMVAHTLVVVLMRFGFERLH
jgi:membrane protease YdiL (CAAX protease family)